MNRVEIEFKNVKCKCGGHAIRAERCKYQNRWKLYCSDCGKYIKFASQYDKVLILAREKWLEEHKIIIDNEGKQ